MKSQRAGSTLFLCALGMGLLSAACVERALDGEPVLAVIDLGRPAGDGGAPIVDLSSSSPKDLASADLASSVGVVCETQVCTTSEICCPVSGKPAACLPVMGMQNNCPFGDGWRCDGPEDCENNRICYGSQFDPDVSGSPGRTRCRPVQMVGGDFRIVCRKDSDCMPNQVCRPNDTTIPGAPTVSTCRFSQD